MISNSIINTCTLPCMAVRGIVPLPNNEIRLDVGRKQSLESLKHAQNLDKYIVLLVQNNNAVENPTFNDLNPNGIVCKIVYDMEGTSIHKVKFNAIVRCKVTEYIQTDPFLIAQVTTKPQVIENPELETAALRVLQNEIATMKDKQILNNPDVKKVLQPNANSDRLCDVFVFNMPIDAGRKVKYLAENVVEKRIEYLIEDIRRDNQIRLLEEEIENNVKQSMSEAQKEYYLREKIKAIHKELGDKEDKDTEVETLRQKILACKMPENMEKKALEELKRYSTLSNQSGEASVSKTYLDFVVSLPWSNKTIDTEDIRLCKEQLDKDHYGLEKVKDRILEYLAVRIMTKKTPQAILCFQGPPGVGKTSLAKSIAKALNKNFVKISLGGVKDESEIRGHRRTYLGALPGRILNGMKQAKSTNPVFLLDEIDKLASDYKGDPASSLLEVLDREQNHSFSDHYLEEGYDLSNVFFITTSNYLENIPAPLRDRLEIVELSSYTEYEKLEIAKSHLIDKQLELHGLSKCDFSISDKAILRIIQEYTKEAGVRQLERFIGTLIRRSIKSILLKETESVQIDEENLEKWLGKPRFAYTQKEKEDQVGVVTGLAYTQYGGDTLPVEVTYYKGKGALVLTGKLGDVMKESAMAALSYVKSNCDKFAIDPQLFIDNDIHIHVPEGAIPKDGPSAGVTLACAIVSCFSKRLVRCDVGMTGEITLRGKVLPIGGLREKAIAAYRSGLKTIVIPKDNLVDVEDIPQSVKDNLTIVPATFIDDVISVALR